MLKMKQNAKVMLHLTWTLFLGNQQFPLLQAETPAPQQLVPENAWAVLTIPSYDEARKAWNETLYMQFWNDPAMSEFREHAEKSFDTKVSQEFENKTGFSLSSLSQLIKGQATLALFPSQQEKQQGMDILAIMDSGDQATRITDLIELARNKSSEAGHPLKPLTIQNLPFYSAEIDADLPQFGSSKGADSKSEKLTFTFGQVDSVLLASSSTVHLEQTIQRIRGGGGKAIASQASFNQFYQKKFRNAAACGFIQFQPIYALIKQFISENAPNQGSPQDPIAALMPKPETILKALGLEGIQGLGFSWASDKEGSIWDFAVQVPTSQRTGLLGLVEFESKDASPPTFVTEDVSTFQRIRFDARKSWQKLEAMLGQISPQIAGVLQMTMNLIGKDRDPNFDFRRNFIENLGDDFIVAQWSPATTELTDVMNPPEIILIGSPNPEPLVKAFIAASGLLPGGNSVLKERSFLGRTIYSINIPTGAPAPGANPNEMATMGIHFVASGTYVAFSTDEDMIESYLRSGNRSGRPLKNNPEFQQAAQSVGGFNSGYINYQSFASVIQLYYESFRTNPDSALSGMLGAFIGEAIPESTDSKDGGNALIDFKKLPPYDQVKKYFHFNVTGNNSDETMLNMISVSPIPSQLKR
jgi:hypothetical protein